MKKLPVRFANEKNTCTENIFFECRRKIKAEDPMIFRKYTNPVKSFIETLCSCITAFVPGFISHTINFKQKLYQYVIL